MWLHLLAGAALFPISPSASPPSPTSASMCPPSTSASPPSPPPSASTTSASPRAPPSCQHLLRPPRHHHQHLHLYMCTKICPHHQHGALEHQEHLQPRRHLRLQSRHLDYFLTKCKSFSEEPICIPMKAPIRATSIPRKKPTWHLCRK